MDLSRTKSDKSAMRPPDCKQVFTQKWEEEDPGR